MSYISSSLNGPIPEAPKEDYGPSSSIARRYSLPSRVDPKEKQFCAIYQTIHPNTCFCGSEKSLARQVTQKQKDEVSEIHEAGAHILPEVRPKRPIGYTQSLPSSLACDGAPNHSIDSLAPQRLSTLVEETVSYQDMCKYTPEELNQEKNVSWIKNNIEQIPDEDLYVLCSKLRSSHLETILGKLLSLAPDQRERIIRQVIKGVGQYFTSGTDTEKKTTQIQKICMFAKSIALKCKRNPNEPNADAFIQVMVQDWACMSSQEKAHAICIVNHFIDYGLITLPNGNFAQFQKEITPQALRNDCLYVLAEIESLTGKDPLEMLQKIESLELQEIAPPKACKRYFSIKNLETIKQKIRAGEMEPEDVQKFYKKTTKLIEYQLRFIKGVDFENENYNKKELSDASNGLKHITQFHTLLSNLLVDFFEGQDVASHKEALLFLTKLGETALKNHNFFMTGVIQGVLGQSKVSRCLKKVEKKFSREVTRTKKNHGWNHFFLRKTSLRDMVEKKYGNHPFGCDCLKEVMLPFFTKDSIWQSLGGAIEDLEMTPLDIVQFLQTIHHPNVIVSTMGAVQATLDSDSFCSSKTHLIPDIAPFSSFIPKVLEMCTISTLNHPCQNSLEKFHTHRIPLTGGLLQGDPAFSCKLSGLKKHARSDP